MRYYLRRYENSPHWYFKVTDEGRVVQNWKSTGKRRKRDANDHAAAKVQALESSNAAVSIDEAFELLGQHKERKRVADATMEKTSLKASHIRTHFGPARNVLSISISETTGYLDKRRRDGAADSTIAMELRELTAALRQLKRFGRYSGDPSALWPDELPHKFPGRTRWLPFDQYRSLVDAMRGPTAYYRRQRHGSGRHGGAAVRRQLIQHKVRDGRDWSEHLVMYTYTNMRWGELYRPTAGDIRGDQLFIRGTKTDDAERWISLHPDALAIVQARAQRRPRGPLFPMESPNAKAEYRAWHVALKRACAFVGIEHASTNDLRRTFCSWCFQTGVPMELVIKWMGHASSRMVMEVYAQPSAEQGRREIGKLPSHPAVTPPRENPTESA